MRDDGGKGRRAETILCVANVSRVAQAVELDLAQFSGRVPVEMLGGAAFPPIGQLPYLLTLPPYGFFWFVLATAAQMPAWHAPAPEALPDLNTFVVRSSLEELLTEPGALGAGSEVLPAYLPKRRWFGGKDEKIERVEIAAVIHRAGYGATGAADGDCGAQRARCEIAICCRSVSFRKMNWHRSRRCRSSWRWRACGVVAHVGC
jgi:hypothetical protein